MSSSLRNYFENYSFWQNAMESLANLYAIEFEYIVLQALDLQLSLTKHGSLCLSNFYVLKRKHLKLNKHKNI